MGEVCCIGCARASRRGGGCALCAAAIARQAAAIAAPQAVASASSRRVRAALTAIWIASGLAAIFFLGTDRPLAIGMFLLLVAVAACVLLVRLGETAVAAFDVAAPPRAISVIRLPRRM